MKITTKRAKEILPLFAELAAAQERFWDALREVEQELDVALDSTNDFIDITTVEVVKEFCASIEAFQDGDGVL